MPFAFSNCRRLLAVVLTVLLGTQFAAAQTDAVSPARLNALEENIQRAEDVSAIKRLQRAYGYYLDKGMWEDLADLFADDAVANYPAGVYIGKPSIRRHLYMNVGGGQMGDIGLGDGRLYNHMNLQPVVHLDASGTAAQGRWRAFAMFGNYGGAAVWAEGVYQMGYVKQDGVWKIRSLDYHAGFGAPYETGWANTGPRAPRGPRELPHPADRERNMPCEGFPEACLAPFHYANLGKPAGGLLWPNETSVIASSGTRASGNVRERAVELARRAARLRDEHELENLQKIYGYYMDRALWDQVADLFTADATIEMGLQGVYAGKPRIREFLGRMGPQKLVDGWLNDHVQLQILVTVAPDGATAKSRSRELGMTGVFESHGNWSEGIYENSYVREDGVWKIKSMRFFPTFITDYDHGWAEDAQPIATASRELPPDRDPTETYEIYPKAHIPAYHYDNPVTARAAVYPAGQGRPSRAAIRTATAPVRPSSASDADAAMPTDLNALIVEAERQTARAKDYHELENLESGYGYYLDKNLWNDLADIFAVNGSMELAQRGIYKSRDRVRGFLHAVFGRGGEGPVAGRLGNHLQMQPVIHVSPDGSSANIRVRVMQQLTFGERASMGGSVYENVAIKENGVWKFQSVHTYNTWTAGYDGGWARNPGRGVPGPSESYPPDGPPTLEFSMFPNVYDIPFHYDNPVTGRTAPGMNDKAMPPSMDTGMPIEIAEELRDIGARIEVPRTAALYAPLLPSEPYEGVTVNRDLSYGPHARNVLDVFSASDAAPKRPVLVFIHGGGFSRGAKSAPDSPFYDNVMLWAVSKDLLGININYRLAPEFQWPAGIEDLTALLAWLKDNVADYGGDPGRIVLWGHSAGAAHAADYIANAAMNGRGDGLAGAVLTSGFYELGNEVSVWEAYYGADVTRYDERSSLSGLLKTTTPLLVTDAELDPESFQLEARKLTTARTALDRPVQRLHLIGHSHISETYAVGTSDKTLSGPVHEFVKGLAQHMATRVF
jgi:acetyl esterase/lipase